MKNKLLIFLGIFIFMIIPKNVYAKDVIPYSSYINNQTFSSNYATNNVSVSTTIQPNTSFTYNIIVTNGPAFDQYNNVFLDYPYVQLYFYSNRDDLDKVARLTFSQTSTCNVSCFNNYNITIYKLNTGQYADGVAYRYAMILPIAKYNSNPDLGDSEVSGSIQFTNRGNNAFFIRMTNILISDSPIIDVNNNIILAIDELTTNITNTFNSSLDLVKNALTDESGVSNNDVSNKTSEWASRLAGTGPVSQMVLMPITLLNGYVSGLNTTCIPYNLGNLMGTDIILPCVNISNYVGASLWSVIDILFSGFMIYAIGKKFVKIFNDFTNLRDNQMDELYGGGK